MRRRVLRAIVAGMSAFAISAVVLCLATPASAFGGFHGGMGFRPSFGGGMGDFVRRSAVFIPALSAFILVFGRASSASTPAFGRVSQLSVPVSPAGAFSIPASGATASGSPVGRLSWSAAHGGEAPAVAGPINRSMTPQAIISATLP